MVYVTGALVSKGSQGEPDADQLFDQKEMAGQMMGRTQSPRPTHSPGNPPRPELAWRTPPAHPRKRLLHLFFFFF